MKIKYTIVGYTQKTIKTKRMTIKKFLEKIDVNTCDMFLLPKIKKVSPNSFIEPKEYVICPKML